MATKTQTAAIFVAAASIRLFLFTVFPSLPDILGGRVEISTPVTSFKRLQEGLFLYTHNVSPYDGGIFHQAPLLLPLFSMLPSYSAIPLATNLLYTGIDLLSASTLMQIADTGESVSARLFTSPQKNIRWGSVTIGAGFLFNPFTIATCIAQPTSAITNLFILLSIAKAARGASFTFLFAISFASYLSLHPILLFPPLAILCYDARIRQSGKQSSPLIFTISHVAGLLVGISTLLFLSYILTGSWEFIASTYGVRLLLPDLTPNVGLWWYFFIEMFDSFRNFFLGVFWLHMASYTGGLSIRFRKQPLFVAVTMTGIFAIFQPYPSIADSALYLSLIPLYWHIFRLTRYTFVAFAALLYASFLGPSFYHLWIYAGSGNANFFYAITLVWSLGLTIMVGDSIYAVLRDEWEFERPEMKGKDAVRI